MLILILAAFLVLVPQVARSQCVDYGDYLQRLGAMDTPRLEEELAISGTMGYVVTSDYYVDGTSSLQVIDLSNPVSPTVLGSVVFPGATYGVAVCGTWAYVANGNQGLRVIDVSNPASPTVVGTLHTPGNNANGVAVSGTLVYVADCLSGLQVIDVSNPASPTIVGYANTPACALDVAVSGTVAYVAANVAGLQLIDVSNPLSPSLLGRVDTPFSADRVAVYGTTALVVDDDLYVIDVSNPLSPAIMQTISTGFGGAYDVAVSESGAGFVATNWNGLMTLDISNPAQPIQRGRIKVKGSAWAVAVSSGLACAAIRSTSGPEQFSGIEVFDASNPASPPNRQIAGIHFLTGTGYLSVAIDGTKVYTTGLYRSGACPYPNPPCVSSLKIFDVSNPSVNPLGTVNTSGYPDGIAVSGTMAYVADGVSGLQVIDVSNPSSPYIVGTRDTPGAAVEVAVSGTMAYVADWDKGLQVIDVSNPSAPVIVKAVDTPGYASGVDVSGSLACVVDGASGLRVIDISHPVPQILGSVNTPGNAMDVAVTGSLAYVTDDDPGAGFQVIDLSNPHSPNILATLDLPGIANGIVVSGSTAYVADGTEQLQVIDISIPSSPFIIGEGPPRLDTTRKIAISGQIICMTNANAGTPVLIFPSHCLTPPVVQNPGTQNGTELQYLSVTVNATDADQHGLTMSPVGPFPAWATFSDLGSGTAVLSGVPQSGQAGTYPVSIRAADDVTATTVSFNIVIAPSTQVGVDESLPLRFRLAASPNPFRAGINIEFALERKAQASVVILDLQGRKVRDLVTGEFPAGTHRTSWGGQNDRGRPLGPGLYFARLTTGDGRVQVQKLFKIR